MSWNYSGDPRTSAKNAVRFYVQDIHQDDPMIQDEEILYLLEQEGDILLAAASVAEALASRFAREVEAVSIGDYSEKRNRAQRYLALAESLRKTSVKGANLLAVPFAGGISKAQKQVAEANHDREKPLFRKGMHDFPGDGR